MSSPLLHSSTVQGLGREADLEMYRSMVAFQKIKNSCMGAILAGGLSCLTPGASLMAQTPDDAPIPAPQGRPSLDSYSLPPGPGQRPQQDTPQGPVDEGIIIVPPQVVNPRVAPAETTRESEKPAATSAAAPDTGEQTQQPVRQDPAREVRADLGETTPALEAPPAITEQNPAKAEKSVQGISRDNEPDRSVAEPSPPPIPATDSKDWLLLLVTALFFILLGALYLWRARRGSRSQQQEIKVVETAALRPDVAKAEPDVPLQPAPVITLGFVPHRANTTLLNAVVGFELTLSNHSGEQLTDIRVNGTMGQAGDHTSGDFTSVDLPHLHAIPKLGTGDTEKVGNEFRLPLNSIRPIIFQSQALFVPLVRLSIEYTDGSGFRHFQTAAYLVGLEHQPRREKMAPLRLDLGPRSFAPLGHRPFATG